MCHLLKGDYDDALEQFTQASAVGDDRRYRANMAVALGMLGRYNESMALYEQIVGEEDAKHNLRVIIEARKDRNVSVDRLLTKNQATPPTPKEVARLRAMAEATPAPKADPPPVVVTNLADLARD